MRALVVQPPFVQLNAPYPAIHWLAAWLRGRGIETGLRDHSIEVYRSIFSRNGLAQVFDEAERRLATGLLSTERVGQANGNEIARYLSYRRLYEDWVDPLVEYLAGRDPAFAHRLAAAAEFPRGSRAEAFLEAREGRPGTEDAPLLASLLLEDLGDLIVHTVDRDFGTVHYGERLARSRGDFGEVLVSLESGWIMREFYKPLLRAEFAATTARSELPELLLVSIPFPGSLIGALVCAKEARAAFGSDLRVIFGGGYVSTELRGIRDPRIFDFCDFLCFDAGFGGLASILEGRGEGSTAPPSFPPFRTMWREAGRIRSSGSPPADLAADPRGTLSEAEAFPMRDIVEGCDTARWRSMEALDLVEVHPDYRDFDPSRYLRPHDSFNPMHRLWSESPWLKFRLAQGCYWSRCAFCDTELDYVASFVPADLSRLGEAMDRASARTGLFGIHFVDEAMPMARLLAFAEANRRRAAQGEKTFHYWGNVRFDAAWTADRVELLAASGLVAVSGGIEVASERGLAMTDKGFDLETLVKTLVSMRRAGLLVHAYLIYGFPGQDEAGIIEAADIVRGLFASGLVDSAFWHRFVLTRHSRMLAEWKAGRRPELVPRDRGGAFAANDLEFEGESAYDDFGAPLDEALGSWMEGLDLDRPASSWFKPRRSGGQTQSKRKEGPATIEELIAKAEAALDGQPLPDRARVFWTAGLPLVATAPGGTPGRITWARRGILETIDLGSDKRARSAAGAIARLASLPGGLDLQDFREDSRLEDGELLRFRDLGLACL